MSVYRDTNATSVFEHPHPGPLTAAVYRDGLLMKTVNDITSVEGRFSLPLSYEDTKYDGVLRVRWFEGSFERFQEVEVVTPLVSISKIRTLFSDSNWTDADLEEIEEAVRVVIEAYTGQNFGYSISIKRAPGTGASRLALPARLNRIINMSGGYPASIYTLSSDGWSIGIANDNWMTIKEAPPEEFMPNVWYSGGAIRVPDFYFKEFRKSEVFDIYGEWGWSNVPAGVQDAAMLLANDFACNEVLYRDRYLEAVKYGDTTLTYSAGAFRGTGNARADLLLDQYKRSAMVVI